MAPVRRSVTSLPADGVPPPKASGRKLSSRPSVAVAAERRATAIRLHAEGATPETIATAIDLSASTVKGWMRDRIAFPRRPAVQVETEEDRALAALINRAAELWATSASRSEISAAIEMPESTLKGVMQRNRDRFPPRSKRTVAALARVRHGAERAEAAVGGKRAARRAAADPAPAGVDRAPEVDEVPVSVDAPPVSTLEAPDLVDAGHEAVAAETEEPNQSAPADAADLRPRRLDTYRPLKGFDAVPLYDRLATGCRWPVYPEGTSVDGVALHCCGRPTGSLKLSYCADHDEIGITPAGRAARAARDAEKKPRVLGRSAPINFMNSARA